MSSDNKGTVLIVDDTETNIDILMEALSDEFDLSVALDGETALALVKEIAPDLILLDIIMPGMDGYEVCRRLKSDRSTRDIPVIFLTAMTEVEDEARGLELGALDYITKPFNPELVKARVRNQLALRQYQIRIIKQRDRIEDDYLKIKELERLRDELVHMIAHDMRNPLTGIIAYLALTLGTETANLNEDIKEYIQTSLESAGELNGMITALLDVSRLEAGKMPLHYEKCSLKTIIDKGLKQVGGLIHGRKVEFDSGDNIPKTYCDPNIIERVVVNLLSNALKFTPSDGLVRIELSAEPQWNRITVSDTGPGIPAEYHQKIFEKFGQVELRKENRKFSTGLGLSFCRLAIDAQGGSITVESEPGQGTKFHVRLPVFKSEYIAPEKLSPPEKAEESPFEEVVDEGIAARDDIKVMVVDDNRHITESLRRYLEIKTEWSITEVNNSERVIRKALEIKPDLVVLDIDMPGMVGPDIAKELADLSSIDQPAIVFFTGLIRPEDAGEKGVSKMFGDFPTIAKGIPLVKFLSILEGMLEKRDRERK